MFIVAAADLVPVLQGSNDGGTTWFGLAQTAVGGAGNFMIPIAAPICEDIRVHNNGAGAMTTCHLQGWRTVL